MATLYRETNPSSSSNRTYETIVTADGRLECNCRGWTVLKIGRARECTHTKEIVRRFNLRIARDGDYLNVVVADFPKLGGTVPTTPTTPKPNTGATRKTNTRTTMVDGVSIIEYEEDEEPVLSLATPPISAPPVASRKVTVTVKEEVAEMNELAWVNPMLAEKLPDGETLDAFYAEPRKSLWAMETKYDGERITLAVGSGTVKAWNRPQRGKEAGENELNPAIIEAAEKLQDGTYDGEVYIPGGTSSDVRTSGNENKRVLVLFDITRLLNQDVTRQTYDQRREYLEEIFKNLEPSSALHLAESVAPNPEFLASVLADGGEGVMIKRRAARYQPGKRVMDMIKIKTKEHATMIVTGYEAGKLGPHSTVMLKNPLDGSTTSVKTLNNAAHRAFAKNPDSFIGRRLVIEYQFRTKDESYRSPMWDRWEDE
jgi:hypothetical protein